MGLALLASALLLGWGGLGGEVFLDLMRLELRAGMRATGVVTYHVSDDDEQNRELKGGQGLVKKAYSGTQGSDTRDYFALKQPLDPRRLRGHAREAQVYFNLNPDEHPHLAFLADVARYEGMPLLVMEWADSDLRRWLQEQRSEPVSAPHIAADRVGKAIQLARGLRGLHKEQMVHQDLKSGNVLLYKQVLKIADFGLSCSAGDGSNGSDGTAATSNDS